MVKAVIGEPVQHHQCNLPGAWGGGEGGGPLGAAAFAVVVLFTEGQGEGGRPSLQGETSVGI